MQRPWLVHLRAIVSIFGSICSVYAFTHLPLAEAYALIFLVPFFVTLFSMLLLGEPIGWRRWLAVAFGFVGILLVVRPGFREITLAHGAGLGVAVTAGINFVLMRKLAGSERRTTLIATLYLYLLAAYGLLLLRDFHMPDRQTMLALLAAGCFSGVGHQLILTASKLAPASHIGPVQYSQIGWAIFYGIVFFGEDSRHANLSRSGCRRRVRVVHIVPRGHALRLAQSPARDPPVPSDLKQFQEKWVPLFCPELR